MTISSGSILVNRYRVASQLGCGGFGAVYRAWDLTLSHPCAIKENFDVSTEAQRQFLREATVLANLSHPNLPRVTDHFVIEGQGQYLVMDFIDGDDLDQIVTKKGVVRTEQAIAWMLQVMDALVYLHTRSQPVIHRDIKPSNIKITPDDRAVLVDFGLVKLYDPHMRTTAGARAITAGFSPPEQYGQAATDARTDIYSLGATLYMLLIGKAPMESVLRVGQDSLLTVQEVDSSISDSISQITARAMALGPNQRFQTMLEFRTALNQAAIPLTEKPHIPQLPSISAGSMPTTHLAAVPAPIPRGVRQKRGNRKWTIIAFGGAAVLVMAAIGIIFGLKLLSGSTETAIIPTKEAIITAEPAKPPIVIEGLEEETFDTPLVVSNGYCDVGDTIQKIQAMDEYTIQFILCKSDPAFLAKLATGVITIQPLEWIAWTGGWGDFLHLPIGTGPYYLEEWLPGDSIILQKNPYFQDYPVLAETAIVRWEPSSMARLRALQVGTVNEVAALEPTEVKQALADNELQVIAEGKPNTFYIGFNNTYAPWSDLNVRKAIAHAIDRQKIINDWFPADEIAASHFTPCSVPHGCDGLGWGEAYGFDPEKAKALLAAAGYPNGFSTRIYYRDVQRSFLPMPNEVAAEIKRQLKVNLNIEAELVPMESSEFLANVIDGQLDGLFLMGWAGDYNHITDFLNYNFGRENKLFGDPNPEIWEVLELAMTSDNPTHFYEEANNAILKSVPMIPVAHTSTIFAARKDLKGANAITWGMPDLSKMQPGDGSSSVVYLQTAEPISLYSADTDDNSMAACSQMLQGLVKIGEDGNVEPLLAESFEYNDSMDILTFHLRKDVKFHNGFSLDANDVVASFGAAMDVTDPYHIGNLGIFEFVEYIFGMMND